LAAPRIPRGIVVKAELTGYGTDAVDDGSWKIAVQVNAATANLQRARRASLTPKNLPALPGGLWQRLKFLALVFGNNCAHLGFQPIDLVM
jgi:hypothetical protein